MQVFNTVEQMTVQKVLADIVCNKCGRSCLAPCLRGKEEDLPPGETGFPYATLCADWGYFSSKDLERHESHICELCYDAFVATFAVPPEITEVSFV